MSDIFFLMGVVVVLGGVVALIQRRRLKAAKLTEHEDFQIGYDFCLKVCQKVDGIAEAKETAEIFMGLDDMTPWTYGFVCCYMDLTNSPRPAPWGKA